MSKKFTVDQDPHFEREKQNYENPIASRESILELLKQSDAPLKREQIAAAFSITEPDPLEGLRRRLRAMERDGQAVYIRNGSYGLPERMDLMRGKILGHRDGFGFFRPDDGGKDLFVDQKQMHTVFHGDVVLAQHSTFGRGKRDARIVRVVEFGKAEYVGRFFVDGDISFVVPDEARIAQDIIIPPECVNGARNGQVVIVKITKRPTRHQSPLGEISQIMGDEMDPGMEIDIALRNHDLPHEFSDAVAAEIADLGEEVPESAKEGRVDLRDLPLITIDGEDARDFDDAVYCQRKKSGGWRLWVAIADVSSYVKMGTALDTEALERGNSVYFPANVIPMLPEILSNGLCSLNPKVDRLCMVCEMTISEAGNLSGYKFYPALMNSHARLTYNKVAAMLEGDKALCEEYAPVLGDIKELHKLYTALNDKRLARGAIAFETSETQFVFNENRKIDKIVPLVRNDAHKMIEECMILANVASAKFVEKHSGVALFRVHDTPGDEKLTNFRAFLGELGLSLGGGDKPTPADYAELLEKVKDRDDSELIQIMLLRSMKQAVYAPEDDGHFGLALDNYSHFTSPIRRYPDLILHRTIKSLLIKLKKLDQDYGKKIGAYRYENEQVSNLGDHCSMTERRADDATRDVADWLKCEYMLDHVGDTFSGTISTVTSFGCFVRLDDINIEGLLHISALDEDYYHFDPVKARLVAEHSNVTYHMGDRIEVKVASVNLDDKKIDLTLSSFKPKKRRSSRSKPPVGSDKSGSDKPNKRSSGKRDQKKSHSKSGASKPSNTKSRPGKNARDKKNN
ncbi:ribonuclease R [Psychrobium sp. 1_MG-2023]|uniref:ribonuclease R n=1 Tax=Psychrobium sp. 1_MG-2023 TaxID=3062624 RepID=UPI000C341B27|nr:ribonuclease R [Psychrobium sp. 1_MG-2023]MDP2561291.1 ribonuclease R [Psychrobium sp. 1_MG-2023]PKF54107.1 ribonuclease R [Alteromonadales bacterium alter-6D02]